MDLVNTRVLSRLNLCKRRGITERENSIDLQLLCPIRLTARYEVQLVMENHLVGSSAIRFEGSGIESSSSRKRIVDGKILGDKVVEVEQEATHTYVALLRLELIL